MLRHPLNPRPLPRCQPNTSRSRSSLGAELMAHGLHAQFDALNERSARTSYSFFEICRSLRKHN